MYNVDMLLQAILCEMMHSLMSELTSPALYRYLLPGRFYIFQPLLLADSACFDEPSEIKSPSLYGSLAPVRGA